MESRGWVERTNTFPEEWRDTRRITDAGRALLTGKTAEYDANYPDEEEDDYDASPEIDRDEDPVGHYAHGACWIYALAVHDLTGLPMVVISSPDEGPVHTAVKRGGKLLDSMGEFTLAQIGKRYGLSNPTVEPITEKTVEAFYGIEEDELEHAKALASKQLKHLGIKITAAAGGAVLDETELDESSPLAELLDLHDKIKAENRMVRNITNPHQFRAAMERLMDDAEALHKGLERYAVDNQRVAGALARGEKYAHEATKMLYDEKAPPEYATSWLDSSIMQYHDALFALGYGVAKTAAEWKKLPATAEWVNRAKLFLKDKWEERHKELQREGVPTDLKGACKFASLFAHKLFGGKMVGTAEHQALSLGGGNMLDLTDLLDVNTFHHDKEFWMNPEHEESMKSIEPRVQQWTDEFYHKYWQDYFKLHTAAEVYLYHGTTASNFERIMLDGGVMEAGSFWGTERIADTYAEEAVDAASDYDAGEEQAIIRVPLSRFNKASLMPDDNSVAEPLTYTLKRTEEDLYADWQKAKGTWRDSLRIYESVRYDAPITIKKQDRYV
jgi:hypothetical protein